MSYVWKFRRAVWRVLNGIFAWINVTITIRLNGRWVRIPILGSTGSRLLYNEEPEMVRLIRSALSTQPGAFIDVGVNVGQTLIKLRSVNSECAYFGFEPNIRCVAYVTKLIAANRWSDTSVMPLALADDEAIVEFFSNGQTGNSGSITKGFRAESFYKQSEYVVAKPGDELLSKLGVSNISIIKIDTEGGELDVLKGLRKTLQSAAPIVAFEALPTGSLETEKGKWRQERLDKIHHLFTDANYQIYQRTEGNQLKRISAFQNENNPACRDYVALPDAISSVFINSYTKT